MSLIPYKSQFKHIKIRYPKLYSLVLNIASFLTRKINLKIKVTRRAGNLFVANKVIFRKSTVKVRGKDNSIQIGSESVLSNCRIIINGSGHNIYISDKVKLLNTVICVEDGNNTIEIGEHTSINGAEIALTEFNHFIKIGHNCLFSSGIDIRNGDSHSILDNVTGKRINYAKNITIGNCVWLGRDVKVTKGAIVENDCVIGVGSFVSSKIPQNSVAVGVPAKVIKENITWKHERIYDI